MKVKTSQTKSCLYIALLVAVGLLTGCSGYSALSSGEASPAIVAAGWANGSEADYSGDLLVLEVFATW